MQDVCIAINCKSISLVTLTRRLLRALVQCHRPVCNQRAGTRSFVREAYWKKRFSSWLKKPIEISFLAGQKEQSRWCSARYWVLATVALVIFDGFPHYVGMKTAEQVRAIVRTLEHSEHI